MPLSSPECQRQPKRPIDDALRLISKLEGAYSENSLRAYLSDLRIYAEWCFEAGIAAFPARPGHVASFLQHDAKAHRVATVSRRIAAIVRFQKLLGYPSIGDALEVELALRRIKRRYGTRQEQVLGITSNMLTELLEACPDGLRGSRDKVLLSLGYDTLCRRSELVSLRFEDARRSRGARSGAILVRRSKSDPFGQGRLAFLSDRTVTFLDTWQRRQECGQGLILVGIKGAKRRYEGLHPASVARIIKASGRRAGLPDKDLKRISGHSLRIGAAQDMAAAGIGLPAIMQAGGWRSPNMVLRYIENLEVSQSGMAQLQKLKGF